MVMARVMPRDSMMKGVLAPFPLPGAPFNHTTSAGACSGAVRLASSLRQHASNTTCAPVRP